jgi:hypothetical protein
MLKTLSNIEKSKVQLVLSEITKKFTPSPFDMDDESTSSLYKEALAEIFDVLNINSDSISEKNKQQILSLLLDEMKLIFLDNENAKRAKSRLGNRGELASSQYTIIFPGETVKKLKGKGIKKADVLKVIKNSDDYIHLLKGQKSVTDKRLISLYVKKHRQGANKGHLLVETIRENDILKVSSAWIVFIDDIGPPENGDVLSLLKKFVDFYGIPMKVGNFTARKFYLYEEIETKNTNMLMDVKSEDNQPFEARTILGHPSSGIIEISMAYAIDTNKYYKDLKCRGVKVTAEHN